MLQVYCLVLVGLSLPAPGHSFGILSEAINAFSCGCGCRFYDVGTCETRSKLECQVRRGSQMLNRMFWRKTKCRIVEKEISVLIMEKYFNICETFGYLNWKILHLFHSFLLHFPCWQLMFALLTMFLFQITTTQKCGTVYDTKCTSIPSESCSTIYKNKEHSANEIRAFFSVCYLFNSNQLLQISLLSFWTDLIWTPMFSANLIKSAPQTTSRSAPRYVEHRTSCLYHLECRQIKLRITTLEPGDLDICTSA